MNPALLRAIARRSMLTTRLNPALAAMASRRSLPMGDPFFGALLGKAAGFVLPKVGSLIRKVLPTRGSIAGIASPISLPGAGILPMGRLGRMARAVGGAAALGGGFEAGSRLIGGALGPSGEAVGGFGRARGRYRRMNAGNVKALRRSIRRVCAFRDLARSTISLTKEVRVRKARKKCR